ncbi:MAG: 50S ribosomal protein L22 [Candidatus Omnitrophota bacterium]|nr:MAG: 50S ribosomal protein L22 [Candidatus Omnitrophota bacterium]
MIARAETKYVRISPLKVRPVAELIRGKKAANALTLLELLNKKGAYLLKKVLHSALSNAKNKGYEEDKLFISKVIANPGPTLKRWRAASFGRATMIRKRTSHILIELDAADKLVSDVKVKR